MRKVASVAPSDHGESLGTLSCIQLPKNNDSQIEGLLGEDLTAEYLLERIIGNEESEKEEPGLYLKSSSPHYKPDHPAKAASPFAKTCRVRNPTIARQSGSAG